MNRPTQGLAAFTVGAGLLAAVVVLASLGTDSTETFWTFTVASLVGGVLVAVLYISSRHRSHRAAGSFDIKAQDRELARSNVSTGIVGKASAIGATFSAGLFGGLAVFLGVGIDNVMLALGGLLAGFLVTHGALSSYDLWRARQFYGAEHDVTDV